MRRIVEITVKVLLILAIVVWLTIVFIDFFRTKSEKDPLFCLKTQIKKYPDGETFECIGLGYKMYRYNRSFSAVEFGPFFIKEDLEAKK